jgi:hypothetical protein
MTATKTTLVVLRDAAYEAAFSAEREAALAYDAAVAARVAADAAYAAYIDAYQAACVTGKECLRRRPDVRG